ncbi:nucleoplasmin-like protein ANO39 isoform X2 [Stylophora pistillata]|uniref:Nucleoplasmin-like protein ANO39 n=1 Tax=Stylophora pistillata TaxID=50429 RepID=A0A2B4S1P5_STYPI|nr:nucleoplasmin-like protein ANO39 isoform X2 [Stylophora pistillata]PFX22973.1 Nucleoplasmin-like protein ANO39 [Stylophora pistillata]
MASMEKEYFWGCELSKDKREHKWDSEDEELGKADIDQKLVVSQACLGAKAKNNERNLVQVTTTDSSDNSVTYTILSLTSGRKDQSRLSLAFPASVVFKLIEGSGPIHLTGSVYQELFVGDEDEEDSDQDENDESDLVLSEAKKSSKKRPLITSKGPPMKIARVEAENGEESDEDDDDEEEDSSEESMEMETDTKQKKPAEAPKTAKNKPEGKDAKPMKSTSEEDDEESEEESDDDDDEEDDEEDESDEDDEDDEDESEEEDEIAASLAAKKKMEGKPNKKPPMTNGTAKADKKDKTEKQNKILAQQPSTPKADGKKDHGKKAGAKTPEPLSMDQLKQKLLKTPNLPKKVEKFKNYLKHSFKVTDEAELTKLWDWLKENK